MGKQRKVNRSDSRGADHHSSSGDSQSHSSSKPVQHNQNSKPPRHAKNSKHRSWSMGTLGSFTVSTTILVVSYLAYKYYLQTLVTTPINYPKIISEDDISKDPSRFWGSYRSGLYFGMKARTPQSLVTGLMWFTHKLVHNSIPIRHWCNQNDGLKLYGWNQHDGRNFGLQEIIDGDLKITTSFVKHAQRPFDWTAKISVINYRNSSNGKPSLVSLLFYAATDGLGAMSPVIMNEGMLSSIEGETDELGKFTMSFVPGTTSVVFNFLSAAIPPGLDRLKETVMANLALYESKTTQFKLFGLVGHTKDQKGEKVDKPNFLVHQVTFFPPFDLEIIFESVQNGLPEMPRLTSTEYIKTLVEHKENFEKRFEKVFKLSSKGYSQEDILVAQAVLSNAVGGIGYFYGSSLVQSQYNDQPVSYWDAHLYTAVPSRSFFPRGFLWDEGFHNLLISRWDIEITKDILGYWLDLMNIEGWIPREQILGKEAQARVPSEFVVQRNTNANPPALFLTFESLLRLMDEPGQQKDVEFLKKVFPRLKAWYNWINTTQTGVRPGSYRWRGRNAETDRELNPKTLASGLDDYPRATHPSKDEIHVDLLSWMAYASRIMSQIAEAIGENGQEYAATYRYLSDNKHIDELHWSEKSTSYCDYGLHSNSVKLAWKHFPPSSPGQPPPPQIKVRQVISKPRLQFVEEFGYVSLFPFLLQLLQPDNPKLIKVLNDIRDPKLLWTEFGLRSLAKSSSYYMKYNTQHDPPYWRGPIWINLNYLALRALHHYSQVPGPYQDEAFDIYKKLRDNVVNNILREYKRSGYVWEQYNDKTGYGQGAHPFTGWSALVVLMMAEIY